MNIWKTVLRTKIYNREKMIKLVIFPAVIAESKVKAFLFSGG